MNLKNYRIKTLKEFKKEFSRPGDIEYEWRVRVSKGFVSCLDQIAGINLDLLNIKQSFLFKEFKDIEYDSVILRVNIPNILGPLNISKAMIKKIDLNKKIQKILKI